MQYLSIPVRDIVTHFAQEVLDSYRLLHNDVLDQIVKAETPEERYRAKQDAAKIVLEWADRSAELVLATLWRLQEDRSAQELELKERFAAYYPKEVYDGEDEEDTGSLL